MNKILVLYNPSSAGGRSEKKRGKIEKKLNKLKIPFELHITESEKDLKVRASEAAEDSRDILAVGGDTTFTFVANEILKSKNKNSINLGMIGTGSINDIVRGIGMDDVDKFLQSVKNRITRKIDVGIVKTEPLNEMCYFLGSVGVGLGTTVNKFVENWKEKGIMITKVKPAMELSGFVKGVRGSFSENKVPIPVSLEWDNQKIERDITLLLFQNTPLYSKSLRLNPDTSPYDNIIDCSIINTTSLKNTVGLAVSVLRNKHNNRPEIELHRSSEFTVSSKNRFDIAVDGEVIEEVTRFNVSLLAKGLNIFQPG